MRIGILGPLEVRAGDGATVTVAGARLRTLLIVLALEPGRVVATTRLVDRVWGDHPPAGAANALQALVSRLRRALPAAAVEPHPAGYRLAIDPEDVDATRFERLVTAGRSALAEDPAAAARLLAEALDLWRGPALLDVANPDPFRAAVAHLSELWRAALEDRVEADLRLGRGAQLTSELAALVAEHPLRERLVGALMRALCAAGRPAEALAVYQQARESLAEELGTDPSPELAALHTAVLRGELTAATPAARTDRAPRTGPAHRTDPAAARTARTNLRAGLTSFVGRDEDVAEVGKLVGEHRLTTLTGPGGSGKTRLAVETARNLLEQLPDGGWLVELAPVRDPAAVPPAVLAALGLREQALTGWAATAGPADRLAAALGNRSTLLVLDNCEHLIDAVATLAERLLGECQRLRILATSREPLGITGEALWPVEPLALPPEGAGVVEARSYPAVQLLADRAAAAQPRFAVTPEAVPALVRICRALDGMPLAIELAAARLRTLTPEQLASRLDDRFRLLTGGSRTALPRHQTLRAVVDWSWELLSGPEQALLRRLAWFTGGATVEAAEQVCAADPVPADRVLDLLTTLADKSLLTTEPGAEPPRYRMLETIRAYCLERLDQAGEREWVRHAHADYFSQLAEAADPHLRRREQLVWLRRLAADYDNLTAALRGAIGAGEAQRAVRLVAATSWYWWLTGHKAEGAELTATALAVPGPVEDRVRATAYTMAALYVTAGVGDWQQAEQWLAAARPLAERTGHHSPVLRLFQPMWELQRSAREGAPQPPMDTLDSVLDSVLADEDPWVRAVARMNRADIWLSGGHRCAEAEADIRAALAGFRAIGERWGCSYALTELANLLAARGDLAGALAHYDQAIAAATELGTAEDVLWMWARQAQLRWLLGDPAGSAAAMADAERAAARVTWPDALAGLAHAKAELARWRGDQVTARAELARTESLLQHLTPHPVFRAMILDTRAYLDALAGDLPAARAHRAEALRLPLVPAHAPTVSRMLVGVADLALSAGRPTRAAELLAASIALLGGPDRSYPDPDRVAAAVRAALGEPELAEATRRGRAATLETVPGLAAAILDEAGDS